MADDIEGMLDPVAPDGSPLAFYRRLPTDGEPELIHALLAPGASILDIGCGPGRITGPLLSLGHPVTSVDDGPGMIAALPPTSAPGRSSGGHRDRRE